MVEFAFRVRVLGCAQQGTQVNPGLFVHARHDSGPGAQATAAAWGLLPGWGGTGRKGFSGPGFAVAFRQSAHLPHSAPRHTWGPWLLPPVSSP
ncbi:hypothetical protein GCM10010914_16690 [Deinococcus wulumuqiensis]|uniref:Uncharacterized protein n=1 Tax=Deinococcus wulumuqiensis TaxID=980427 RepID=A0AAV4K702_9DEIO|nr:hypothetical protein GCM10010914_16690 [Deinococcus wulumuqiensis]GGP29536.1 hypothetical protein GCM10008021_11870 [Deinococcus wulumuqiensis]